MSIIHVVGGSGGGTHTERTSFVGMRTPEEIKEMIKPLKQIDKTTLRKMLQLIVSSMEGNEIKFDEFKELNKSGMSEDVISVVYTGLYKLLTYAIRIPHGSLKQEHFKDDLQELRLPEDFIPDIASVVYGAKRTIIDKSSTSTRPQLPSLESCHWRVDVGISTSVLNRVLEPAVLMELTLSNGGVHSFEVPIEKFHELRFNVAHVLKEMEELEKRSILKIQD